MSSLGTFAIAPWQISEPYLLIWRSGSRLPGGMLSSSRPRRSCVILLFFSPGRPRGQSTYFRKTSTDTEPTPLSLRSASRMTATPVIQDQRRRDWYQQAPAMRAYFFQSASRLILRIRPLWNALIELSVTSIDRLLALDCLRGIEKCCIPSFSSVVPHRLVK